MTASGTAGHADELEAYGPLAALGAVVVKSLVVEPVAGQSGTPGAPGRRRHAQQRGTAGARHRGLGRATTCPDWPHAGARTVVSIWGQRVDDFAEAAALLAGVAGLTAVEVNVSCPNVEDRRHMFAHSPTATAEVVAVVAETLPGHAPVGQAESRPWPIWPRSPAPPWTTGPRR